MLTCDQVNGQVRDSPRKSIPKQLMNNKPPACKGLRIQGRETEHGAGAGRGHCVTRREPGWLWKGE